MTEELGQNLERYIAKEAERIYNDAMIRSFIIKRAQSMIPTQYEVFHKQTIAQLIEDDVKSFSVDLEALGLPFLI